MINLLPPELKTGYFYAHRNVALRNWVIGFLIALVGLGGVATYGVLSLHQSTAAYSARITAAETHLKEAKLTETQKKVQDISTSLKLAVQVLSKEVLFSDLITNIGAAMPSGAILTGLNINKTSGGIDLTANATNYTTATQVQVNLADPANKIFGKVDINSVSCSSQNTLDPTHPCVVELRALFNTNNQFLFINQGKKL